MIAQGSNLRIWTLALRTRRAPAGGAAVVVASAGSGVAGRDVIGGAGMGGMRVDGAASGGVVVGARIGGAVIGGIAMVGRSTVGAPVPAAVWVGIGGEGARGGSVAGRTTGGGLVSGRLGVLGVVAGRGGVVTPADPSVRSGASVGGVAGRCHACAVRIGG